jgi:hypothetical protein
VSVCLRLLVCDFCSSVLFVERFERWVIVAYPPCFPKQKSFINLSHKDPTPPFVKQVLFGYVDAIAVSVGSKSGTGDDDDWRGVYYFTQVEAGKISRL